MRDAVVIRKKNAAPDNNMDAVVKKNSSKGDAVKNKKYERYCAAM